MCKISQHRMGATTWGADAGYRLFPDIQYEPSNQEHRKLVETVTDWLEAELALYHLSLSADRPFGVDDATSLLRDRVNYIENSMAQFKPEDPERGRDDG